MNIGIDASRADSVNSTGTENYSLNLIKHLAKIDEKNSYVLYSRKKLENKLAPANLGANFRNCVISYPILWTQIGLASNMIFGKPDVLFVPAHVLPIIHPKNSIVTIHGLEYEYCPENYSYFSRAYLRQSTIFSAQQARKIIVPSENTKHDLVKFYKINPDKIAVIHHGIDENIKNKAENSAAGQERNEADPVLKAQGIPANGTGWAAALCKESAPPTSFKNMPSSLRQDRRVFGQKHNKNSNTEERYILFIGRIEMRKNIIRLTEAFNIFKKKNSTEKNLKLILAGKKGIGFDKIKKAIDRSPYRGDIMLKGYVPAAEREILLKNALIFAYPSLYEGFGLPILEAQTVGVPVITSNTSSIPEVAGKGALLVDPKDVGALASGIEKLIIDKGVRKEIISKGLENVKRFSWEKCARETLDALIY